MRVKARGVFLCAREGMRQMLAQSPHGGTIINMASVAAMIGIERRLPYCASKGAVLALTLGFSLSAAYAAGEAGGSSDPHRLAAKVFKEHNCGSCHTLGSKGQFGYTAHGLEIKQKSLGCVDLLNLTWR